MQQANPENLKKFEKLKQEIEKEIPFSEATPQEKKEVLEKVIEKNYFPQKSQIENLEPRLTEIEKAKKQYEPLISQLIEIAQEEGIEKAVNKALEVSKDNPYLLDAFHDELVDKYFHLLEKS